MSKVSLIKGDNRYQNVKRSLEVLKKDIARAIEGKKKIVIKPNFVSASNQLASSHKEAMRAVLDFLKPLTSQTITLAEGAALGSTDEAWRNFDYLKFEEDYNIRFVDLNKDDFVEVELFDREMKPLKFKVAKTIVESDFRISLARLKTHDTVVVTLTQKNLAVGSLLEKPKIHQGIKAINHNLARLAEIIPPHLSVIDGFEGMEGEGPVSGTPVPMGVALAGLDFLGVDSTACRLMGFDPKDVGYLYLCWQKGLGQIEEEKIEIVGNALLDECSKRFRPHSTIKEQLKWR